MAETSQQHLWLLQLQEFSDEIQAIITEAAGYLGRSPLANLLADEPNDHELNALLQKYGTAFELIEDAAGDLIAYLESEQQT